MSLVPLILQYELLTRKTHQNRSKTVKMDQKKVQKKAKNLTEQLITSAAFEHNTPESILSKILVLTQ